MEPRLTREADNAAILEGLYEIGRAVRYAVLATAPGIAAGILSVLVSEWIAVGTLGLFVPIAMLSIFRAWRVCRSARWNDYWEAKQEKDAAKTTVWILLLPGAIAATIAAAVLIESHWTGITANATSLITTLSGLLG